jgi:hypothetical protein
MCTLFLLRVNCNGLISRDNAPDIQVIETDDISYLAT